MRLEQDRENYNVHLEVGQEMAKGRVAPSRRGRGLKLKEMGFTSATNEEPDATAEVVKD